MVIDNSSEPDDDKNPDKPSNDTNREETPDRPEPPRPPVPPILDALDAWADETPSPETTASPLSWVGIGDGADVMLLLFSTVMEHIVLHFVNEERRYVRCPGRDCPACKYAAYRADPRDLLAVYVLDEKRVAVLPVSPAIRANSLRTLLRPFLAKAKTAEVPVAIAVKGKGNGAYAVEPLTLADGADLGPAVIAEFLRRYHAGEVRLADVYPAATVEELNALPKVAARRALRG